jgi:DeoR/GlpR family transcriptional regulator of sugar metabolism
MLAEERRKQIVERLTRTGQVLAADLVREFNVSEDTIRRDLKELADAGALKKVHGGAVVSTTVPYDYTARSAANVAAKDKIARRAVELVEEGMLIFVDGGTTSALIADHLHPDLRVTFVTYSLATAKALTILRRAEILLLGGRVVSDLLIAAGPESIEQSKQFRPALSIIGVHGITVADGCTVENYDDAMIKREFIRNSADVAVLAGQEKLGFVASYLVADVADVSYLICDAADDRLQPFADGGVTVWRV